MANIAAGDSKHSQYVPQIIRNSNFESSQQIVINYEIRISLSSSIFRLLSSLFLKKGVFQFTEIFDQFDHDYSLPYSAFQRVARESNVNLLLTYLSEIKGDWPV